MKTNLSSRSFPHTLTLLGANLAILGCMLVQSLVPAGTPTPAPPELPAATATDLPTPTATPLPILSIRLMAYNIWLGAGVDPGNVERGGNIYRLADLITVVKQADPDILGLEEVTQWDSGRPTPLEQFASALGMQYYMAPTWRGINLAIFSRYPIIETENLSDYIGNNGALRALVEGPGGQKFNVVIAHLDPRDHVLRTCQFDKLRHIMTAYRDQPSILMGDINTYPNSPDARHLTGGGWQVVQSETIDNIFIFSRQGWSAEPICFTGGDPTPGCIATLGISDHFPVGAILSLYDFPNPASLPVPIPTAAPLELPPEAADALTGVQLLSVTDNTSLPGCADASSLMQFLQPGQAALIRLRISGGFTSSRSKLSINFDSRLANEPGFLRYGLGGGGGGPMTLKPYILTGAGEGSPPGQIGSVTMNPDQWYYLLAAVDTHGAFRTLLWDSTYPSVRMEVNRPADPGWVREQWKLQVEAVDGKVEMSQLLLMEFEGFR